jgi:uncharacterized LabA/DUF88 family protein
MIVFLIDADNLNNSAWIDEAFMVLETEFGQVDTRRAYGSLDNIKSLARVLTKRAIRSFANQSLTKNSTDMALAVDAMEIACQVTKPKVIAIGSGDADFVPLVVRLREKNIRVICVTERGKLASEAVPAYNQVIFVGEAPLKSKKPAKESVPVQSIPAAKKVPAKKVAAKKVVPAKADQSVKQAAPAKKTVAAKKVVPSHSASASTLEQILDAVPALRNGQELEIGKVTEALHAANLIGKSASSPKFLRKFEGKFKLTPEERPNHVRYLTT